MTGKFSQVQTVPEDWSGTAGEPAALDTGTSALWPAGLVTTGLVRCGELFAQEGGERRFSDGAAPLVSS